MSILTHKMRLNRPAELGNKAQLLWFGPPQVGSGTTITDLVNGATITDASLDWTDPHSMQVVQVSTGSGVSSGVGAQAADTADTAYLLVGCAKMVTTGAFFAFGLEDSLANNPKLFTISGGSGVQINDATGAATTASFGTPPLADVVGMLAGSYIPSTGALASYLGEDGGAVSEVNTATADAARIADGFSFSGEIKLTVSVGTRQKMYPFGLFRFPSGLPSTLLADLQQMSIDWPVGKKYLAESFK